MSVYNPALHRGRLFGRARLRCRPELHWDGGAVWAVCEPHRFIGEVRDNAAAADVDGDRHEREEHARWQR